MKVVVLSEGLWGNVLEIFDEVRRMDGVEGYLLITKAKFLGCLRMISWVDRARFVKLHMSGRIKVLASGPHDEETLRWLDELKPDIGLHKMGVIYRSELIGKFKKGILNPHIGILPEYRGRSVMEWSILAGVATGITTFFIDEGIDTGKEIVIREKVDVSGFETVAEKKRHLFELDKEMFVKAIKRLQRPDYTRKVNEVEKGRRYYVMSELLRSVIG